MQKFTEIVKEIAKHSANYKHFISQAKERFPDLYDEEGLCELDDVLRESFKRERLEEPSAEEFLERRSSIKWYAQHNRSAPHVGKNLYRVERICKGCENIYVDTGGGLSFYCSMDCYRRNCRETVPERMIRLWLESKEMEYEQEKRLNFEDFYTYIDFFIPPNVCLYVDGNYHHIARLENVRRDERNNLRLPQEGYIVVRIWEEEILAGKRPKFPTEFRRIS